MVLNAGIDVRTTILGNINFPYSIQALAEFIPVFENRANFAYEYHAIDYELEFLVINRRSSAKIVLDFAT